MLQSALLLGLGIAAGPGSAACEAPRPEIGLQLTHSRWSEVGAQGQRLLRESGELAGTTLGLTLACEGWRGAARWAWRGGQRDYRGLSSNGAAISTVSDITERALQLELRRPLMAGWDWGIRVDARSLDRRLASTGAVQGYPETHRSATLALGLATQGPVREGWRWRGELWLGGGPAGTVDLDFPHADPVRLRSGTRALAEAALMLELPGEGRAWWAELGLVVRGERVLAGPAAALWRHGVLVGAALQPEHRVLEAGARARVGWMF